MDLATGEVMSRVTQMHPVERVTWSECDYVTGTMDLSLPTEAQWEYAARAGTSTPWWTGSEPESLKGAENLCDSTTRAIGEAGWTYEEWSDGYPAHAPVDALMPNPWGFHNILGNVGEWTRDRHQISAYSLEVVGGAGERVMPTQNTGKADRSIRGPGWFRASVGVRVSARYSADESEYKTQVFGLRPARAIDA
jgi:formylglycine-generating enzyme required for sulfatase activity